MIVDGREIDRGVFAAGVDVVASRISNWIACLDRVVGKLDISDSVSTVQLEKYRSCDGFDSVVGRCHVGARVDVTERLTVLEMDGIIVRVPRDVHIVSSEFEVSCRVRPLQIERHAAFGTFNRIIHHRQVEISSIFGE